MYVFNEELQKDIKSKTRDICKYLKHEGDEELLYDFEKFHGSTREHEDVVRYFIKRREVKLFQRLIELKISMPLREVLDDRVWNYLHLMYYVIREWSHRIQARDPGLFIEGIGTERHGDKSTRGAGQDVEDGDG